MKFFEKLKPYLKWQLLIGMILGAIGGFMYYKFVGCRTNSCPITSNPYYTVLWGILAGGILFFPDAKKTREKKKN